MDALLFSSDFQIRFSYERNDPTEGNWNSACLYQQNWCVVVFAKMADSLYLNGSLDNWLMEQTSPVKICQFFGLKPKEKDVGPCQTPRNGVTLWGGFAVVATLGIAASHDVHWPKSVFFLYTIISGDNTMCHFNVSARNTPKLLFVLSDFDP